MSKSVKLPSIRPTRPETLAKCHNEDDYKLSDIEAVVGEFVHLSDKTVEYKWPSDPISLEPINPENVIKIPFPKESETDKEWCYNRDSFCRFYNDATQKFNPMNKVPFTSGERRALNLDEKCLMQFSPYSNFDKWNIDWEAIKTTCHSDTYLYKFIYNQSGESGSAEFIIYNQTYPQAYIIMYPATGRYTYKFLKNEAEYNAFMASSFLNLSPEEYNIRVERARDYLESVFDTTRDSIAREILIKVGELNYPIYKQLYSDNQNIRKFAVSNGRFKGMWFLFEFEYENAQLIRFIYYNHNMSSDEIRDMYINYDILLSAESILESDIIRIKNRIINAYNNRKNNPKFIIKLGLIAGIRSYMFTCELRDRKFYYTIYNPTNLSKGIRMVRDKRFAWPKFGIGLRRKLINLPDAFEVIDDINKNIPGFAFNPEEAFPLIITNIGEEKAFLTLVLTRLDAFEERIAAGEIVYKESPFWNAALNIFESPNQWRRILNDRINELNVYKKITGFPIMDNQNRRNMLGDTPQAGGLVHKK